MDEIEYLYKKYYKYIKSYALSLCFDEALAEDITAETFMKAIKNYGKFRKDCRVETWLCRIAHNIFVSAVKKEKSEHKTDYTDFSFSVTFTEETEDKAAAKEVLSVLNGLPSPYKDVFYMKALGEFSYTVIAEVFKKSESWARVTYFRAKQMISERIDSNGKNRL